MQTDLRPMSLGEILDRTAQLYRTNFLLFAGISAMYAGVVLVLNLGQLGLNVLLLHLHLAKDVPLVTLGFLVVIVPLVIICAIVAVAANNRAVAWVNLGQPATIVGAYKSILPRLGRYIWLSLIMGVIVYTPFVVIFGGYLLFVLVYVKQHKMFGAAAGTDPSAAMVVGLISLGFIVLAMAWMVYAILMGLRYSLAIPACVVEDVKAREAIRRSIELSKGSRGRIFMLGLLIVAIQLGLALVTQGFFLFEIFMAASHKQEVPIWVQITQQIVGFFTNSFIGPMYATGLTLFYYDQRIRKEGFDIEWMMEAAGMKGAELPAGAGLGAEGGPVTSEAAVEGASLAEPDVHGEVSEPGSTAETAERAEGASGSAEGPESSDGSSESTEGWHG
jgi:hypothetical protein